MLKQKCSDCPTKLSITKVIGICFFVASSTVGLTKIYFKIEHNTENTKKIADYLEKTGQIPYNLAFKEECDTVYIVADNRIPKKRKNQRITNKETAISNTEDLESIILE